MPEELLPTPSNDIHLAGRVAVALGDLRVQFSRSSGPGGQNVNKVSTRCEMWVKITALQHLPEAAAVRLRVLAGAKLTAEDEIHLASDEARSQERNRGAALDRLRELVRLALVAPKKRRVSKPSKAAKKRRVEAKRKRGDVKSGRRGTGWE